MLLVASCAVVAGTAAVVPSTMNYQGRLTDNTPQQAPITDVVPMQFSIWTLPVGGAQLWSESWATVQVNAGIFSVLLGSNGVPIPSSVFTDGDPRWLEVVVAGETLEPRQQLGAVGWAHKALTADDADTLDSLPASSFQQSITDSCPGGASIRAVNPDGTVVCEFDDTGITSEVDPQVDVTSVDAVPAWDGTKLVDRSLWQAASGNVGLGDATPDDDLHVSRPDGDVASVTVAGTSQGAGRVYVGESLTAGGGISFDGDGSPDIAGGTDRLTLFRRSGGVDTEVLSYGAGSNDVTLTGSLIMDGNFVIDDGGGWHRSYGATGWYNATFGGGIYMSDTTWVRVYGDKNFTTGGNLAVGGTALVGHQIVSASYPVSTLVSSCHSHGGLQCYVGSGSATCPAGKVLLGGGCNLATGQYGGISASYPSGTTWTCRSSHDISWTATVYAICARLGN